MKGIDPFTPAVLIERATCLDERRIIGTIADLPTRTATMALNGLCLVLIGWAFNHAAEAGEIAAKNAEVHAC